MMVYRPFIEAHITFSGQDVSGVNIREKVEIIENWLQKHKLTKERKLLYLIAYDIENNRIRTNIAKFLIRKGCLRVQKSVYVAKSSRHDYQSIVQILKEINELYDNTDSIFLLPIPEEKFSNIKLIGKNIEFEVITKQPSVVFF